jgi:uncharacterized glyoxalase superfamily protein PhnB
MSIAALAFLTDALGLTVDEIGRDAVGAGRFASLRHGRDRVLVQPDLPDELHGSHLGYGWVYIAVPDLDARIFVRARAASAQVLADPHDAFDGTMRGYSARDPEGNLWSSAPTVRVAEADRLTPSLTYASLTTR